MKTLEITKTDRYAIPGKPFIPPVFLMKGTVHVLEDSLADLVVSCGGGEVVEDNVTVDLDNAEIPQSPEPQIPELPVETKEIPQPKSSKRNKKSK